MKTDKSKAIVEDIYDIINDTKFENEARRRLDKLLQGKNVEVDFETNTISIGRKYKITVGVK